MKARTPQGSRQYTLRIITVLHALAISLASVAQSTDTLSTIEAAKKQNSVYFFGAINTSFLHRNRPFTVPIQTKNIVYLNGDIGIGGRFRESYLDLGFEIPHRPPVGYSGHRELYFITLRVGLEFPIARTDKPLKAFFHFGSTTGFENVYQRFFAGMWSFDIPVYGVSFEYPLLSKVVRGTFLGIRYRTFKETIKWDGFYKYHFVDVKLSLMIPGFQH